MAARGKKRQRGDGSIADGAGGRAQVGRMVAMAGPGMAVTGSEPSPESAIYRFADAFKATKECDDLASEVAGVINVYSHNRRNAATGHGEPISYVGRELYQELASTADHPKMGVRVDLSAWVDFRPGSTAVFATRINRSAGAVSRNLTAMIEHGFIERHRVGVHFKFRLALPEAAVIEYAEQMSSRYDEDIAFAKRLLASFRRG